MKVADLNKGRGSSLALEILNSTRVCFIASPTSLTISDTFDEATGMWNPPGGLYNYEYVSYGVGARSEATD